MRGTESGAGMIGQGNRITPACAGNSAFLPVCKAMLEDHPRVCGEQENRMIAARKIQGSPPRVRGTVSYRCFISYVYRITPACAGNRSIKITFRDNAMDHPRVCGEQPLGGVPQGCLQGSPPRVRGTACILRRWCRIDRITPACAGNSFAARSSARASKDHPRVCGEQPRAAAAETVLSGSPPRVRGTGIGGGREHGSHGITPACAGNSLS